jgi:hypothetical protein
MRCCFRVIFFFVCNFYVAESKSQTILDLKKDFGAVGDGRKDDTHAFVAASERINKIRIGITLVIPKGNYLVKPQKASDDERSAPYLPVNLLSFHGCKNITIRGEEGTRIQYAPGLYFGSFRRNGRNVEKLKEITTNYAFRVAVGYGINLEECTNIKIENIELDGNIAKLNVGGPFGDVGIQIDNDGVFIRNSSVVTIQNVYAHHFGRDGILILNQTPQQMKTHSQKLVLTNCRFDYNGRQGLSWVGGAGLIATNCSFSFTGASAIYSAPGAGVDFEPHGGYVVTNGTFENCTFRSNMGVGVLSDVGGADVSGIRLIRCLLVSEKSSALWIKSPGFTLINCSIFGIFRHGYAAQSPAEGTKFIGCHFSDRFSTEASGNFLVESSGTRFMTFTDCSFNVRSLGIFWIAAHRQDAERVQMVNCRFINAYTSKARGLKHGTYVTGADISGETIFIDSSAAQVIPWNMENTRFHASDRSTNVTISSGFGLASYDTVSVSGSKGASVILKGGAFSALEGGLLHIQKGSKIVVEKGGRLGVSPRGNLVVLGNITGNDGAYVCIHQTAKASQQTLKNISLKGKVAFPHSNGCMQLR